MRYKFFFMAESTYVSLKASNVDTSGLMGLLSILTNSYSATFNNVNLIQDTYRNLCNILKDVPKIEIHDSTILDTYIRKLLKLNTNNISYILSSVSNNINFDNIDRDESFLEDKFTSLVNKTLKPILMNSNETVSKEENSSNLKILEYGDILIVVVNDSFINTLYSNKITAINELHKFLINSLKKRDIDMREIIASNLFLNFIKFNLK